MAYSRPYYDLASDDETSVQDLDEEDDLEESPAVCLAMNQAYQEVLQENLAKIYAALEQNRLRQSEIENNLETQAVERQAIKPNAGSRRFTPFVSPFFRDVHNMVPPANEDAAMKRASQEPAPTVKPPQFWLNSDKKRLRDAVKSDTLKRRIQPLMNRLDIEHNKKKDKKNDADQIENRIKALKEEMAFIKTSSDVTIQYGNTKDSQNIDWLKIATMDFKGRKTAVNCQLMWENAVHPQINIGQWTSEEDRLLETLVRDFNYSHWDTIAEDLGTGRTAFQCLQRYQKNLNQMANEPWTKEEEQFLQQVVETVKIGSYINWVQVAFYVDGRSTEQCKERWELLNRKMFKRGKWTDVEDLKLIEAVKRFGLKDYEKIATYVSTRSGVQCRERYMNCLQATLKFGSWTYEEDRKLWNFVMDNELNGDTKSNRTWKQLTDQMNGRTYNACYQRIKLMKRWEEENCILANIPEKVGTLLSLSSTIRPQMQLMPYEQAILNDVRIVVLRLVAGRSIPRTQQKRQSLMLSLQGEVTDRDIVSIKRAVQMGSEWALRQRIQNVLSGIKCERLDEHEQLEALVNEQKLIQDDIKQGIYIPRPVSDINRTRIQSKTRMERVKLHTLIRERIDRALSKVKGGKKCRRSSLDDAYACQDFPVSNPTVAQLLQAVREGKTDAINKFIVPNRNRPNKGLSRRETCHLDSLICRMLNQRFCPPNRLGRPRKIDKLAANLFEQPKSVSKSDIEKEINVLLFTALNLNKAEATKKARSIMQKLPPEPPLPTQDINAALALETLRKSVPSVEAIDHEPKDARTKFLQDVEVLRCAVGDAVDAPADTDSVESEGSSSDGMDLRTSQTTRARSDSTDYRMAPLPPMCASLYAFKTFLLQRKNLVEKANCYHNQGTIDRSLQTHPDAVTVRRNVTGDDIIPSKLRAVPVKDIIQTKKLVESCQVRTVTQTPKSAISKIADSHDYQKLKGRFFSAFMWPAMLSAFPPPPEVELPPGKRKPKVQFPCSKKWKKTPIQKKKKVVQQPRERVVIEADPEMRSGPVKRRGRPKGSRTKRARTTDSPVRERSSRIAALQKPPSDNDVKSEVKVEVKAEVKPENQGCQLIMLPEGWADVTDDGQSRIYDLQALIQQGQRMTVVNEDGVVVGEMPVETEQNKPEIDLIIQSNEQPHS